MLVFHFLVENEDHVESDNLDELGVKSGHVRHDVARDAQSKVDQDEYNIYCKRSIIRIIFTLIFHPILKVWRNVLIKGGRVLQDEGKGPECTDQTQVAKVLEMLITLERLSSVVPVDHKHHDVHHDNNKSRHTSQLYFESV